MKKKKSIHIEKHILIPKHSLCSEKEKQAILAKYKATPNEMPIIFMRDPAIANLKVKVGDLIKIERQDPLSGKSFFYRVVRDE